ncbi:MAG: hypothetical protein A2039_09470 [Candidatus Melainabacteria bacterium GWA2_34_9]|nr:MAG: hypothetical protein A2039_09470 [Candidatus Melainabacteria bacterium GWA2_34_9]
MGFFDVFNKPVNYGNDYQKQKLKETADAVKQYCDPDAASRLKDTELVFDNNLPKNFNGGKVVGKNIIKFAESFTEKSLKDRGRTLCHELSHSDYEKKRNNNPYDFGSKEDELQAISKGASFEQKYGEAQGESLNVPSKEKIMDFLNKSVAYKCLPEKAPITKEEYDKAQAGYGVCIAGINQNNSIFKAEASN